MEKYASQLECKDVNAGKILLKGKLNNNLLLFVSSGSIIINSNNKSKIEINEGHFVLLSANTDYIATAITASHILFIHADSLSDMIIDDPGWDPGNPQVLPILPALAKTLNQIEYYQKDTRTQLN
ncbi:cyclic nucleotide-binding domain-containing protein [Parabacteroides provencensis]|uniref:hypothetical protein n=1 Tax=Parabacteroides provencensis TaxID=1944636 RepID=UPI000C155F9E|nr:hypothetical protein [Parabacteroides provencensis]